jgi:hypothetical protein
VVDDYKPVVEGLEKGLVVAVVVLVIWLALSLRTS